LNRRNFLASAGAIGAGMALGGAPQSIAAQTQKRNSMKLLILGGTGFIGPPMVRYAVERGHEVTIFTRGSKSEVPGVEHLVGDRTGDLDALKGRTWDAVLDNNARDYRWVELTTALLRDSVEQYMFVSTISAYAGEATGYDFVDNPWTGPPIDTRSPLAQPGEGFVRGQELPYGPTKALSEKIAHAAFPGRTTVVRPGFIVGPGDPTDRFTYWPVRIDRGGEVLAPGDGADPVQFIDVRDLCEWIVRLVEARTYGNFNGVGIGSPLSMAEMLYGMRAITSTAVNFTWVPIPFLMEHDVQSYSDMPIWIPGDPLSAVDNSLAMASGLTFRPLAVTAADTLNWHRTRPAEEQTELRIGIESTKEKQVLDAWHKRTA
jgi:2'-hydroxyisoflavone reductase